MNDLPISIQKLAARYKPIETDGLTLYPIKIVEYENFSIAKPAVEVMHQSLPVAFLRVPLLAALYAMDYEAALSGKPATGLFSRTLLMLALALRLGEGPAIEERLNAFRIEVDRKNPARLLRLQFSDADGETKVITPVQYARLRQIIAAQNGIKLESDEANPDIVKAKKDMERSAESQLDADINVWIAAVSTMTGTPEEEIDTWPILKFQRRSDAIVRALNFVVYGIGEASGMVSYPKGNPAPHPFFSRLDGGNSVLSPMGGSADGKRPEDPTKTAAIREVIKSL